MPSPPAASPAPVPGPASGPAVLVGRIAALAAVLFLFFVSLELMGGAFKLMGRGFAEGLLASTSTPLLGLITGLLATSLVQSSSTTTSLTVALVASGALSVEGAVPVMMGANIGTTVTNTIVSMGHITRPEEFRRAMAGATVHDFFNWLAVLVLLPLELAFDVLSRPAAALSGAMQGVGGTELLSPLKVLTEPVSDAIVAGLGETGWLVLAVGLVCMFVALRYLVVILKALVLGRTEGVLHRYIFGHPLLAMGFGVLLTVLVQSSSVTTSLVVPLIGAGIITVRQVFPFTLGANVGTTLTALLAALALAAGLPPGDPLADAALTIAFVHFLFNVFGIVLIYPIPALREVPIRLAEFIGAMAYRNRAYAIVYLVGLFYLLPLALEVLLRVMDVH